MSRRFLLVLALLPILASVFLSWPAQAQADPLPSWNDGRTKRSILDFVAAVTRDGSPDFVPVPERIATFDNDGTLWVEQPMYIQLAFALNRVKALAPLHPEWETQQPFQAVLQGDMETLARSGEKGAVELIMATHADMSTADFETVVRDWIGTAHHPKFNRPYTELVYQPMIELLGYLRGNGFRTFIVSGGGIEFMRPWAERVYGIPPEQVVGSSIKTRFQIVDGRPQLFRLAEINFVDDKAGKPVGINSHIGRRPIAAFGNSDGDLEMLQWATLGDSGRHLGLGGGRRLGVIVHHTDAEREYAYDRQSHIGRLDKALEAAAVNRWTVVDMKADWNQMFPPSRPQGADSPARK